MSEFANVTVIDHPLVQHKLALLRDKNTGTKDFRTLLSELSTLMAYEVTRDLPLDEVKIETPVAPTTAHMLINCKVGVVPILRAGLGMTDGIMNLIPTAKMGHIGLFRDPETLKPVTYYCKLPADIEDRDVIVVDPMLATGGSACEGIRKVKEAGCKSVRLMCLVSVPEGIRAVQEMHPDVKIFTAAIDDHLNEHGYIVPGLGDAGDRIFGTM
ncbi:MAG: uracil phosphoribosyltransferase [Clostridia bacterium]|nr:uracil phosphoribosyltransferase [Clostridia bacterium]MBQ4341320.1 uracil phosphoribosyltransferase [Clostridia bacterium]MBR6428222.1 uracil phosphoribosyltransferase [Clostridia bacterium]